MAESVRTRPELGRRRVRDKLCVWVIIM
jgi:hypothetical protein